MWPQWRGLFGHRNCQKWSGAKVFSTFWFQMSFVPQRHAVFPHLSFQKCCEPEVFWPCFLPNLLRATMAWNFWSLIRPYGSVPRARRFSKPTFRPPRSHKTLKKHIFCAHFFFFYFFLIFSLALPTSAASFVHMVGSLTSYVFLLVVFNIILSGVSFSAACSPPKNTQTDFARWTPWQSYRKWILIESAGVHPADLAADVPCSGAMCAISIWHWEISKTTIFWRGTNLYT